MFLIAKIEIFSVFILKIKIFMFSFLILHHQENLKLQSYYIFKYCQKTKCFLSFILPKDLEFIFILKYCREN